MATDTLAKERPQDRLDRLELDFNEYGYDKYGVSLDRLKSIVPYIHYFYDSYFDVITKNLSNVPSSGRVMIVSNHSGGIPVDGFMISAACLFELEPPRLLHAMVEKATNNLPFIAPLFRELGQLIGLPSNAKSVLSDDRPLLVFPEGAEGAGQLYYDRYTLTRFGTGFMRIALEMDAPILPVGFVGAEEMVPSVLKLERIADWLGVPFIPIPPQILPIPLPVNCLINFGEPMKFDGTGNESDEVIKEYVDDVKREMCNLLNDGLDDHNIPFFPDSEASVERWESDHLNS